MSSRPFVIITTRLPPAACGIGTYSWQLRQNWPGAAQRVEFLVTDSAATAEAGADGVTEFSGSGTVFSEQLERIGSADLLIHYAARAYQRFGCPVWLPGAITRWKARFPGSRVMLLVHEMPGKLPMRSKHFWLARVSDWIVRRLSRVADAVVTNTASHAAELRRITGRKEIPVLPVASNIGGSLPDDTPRRAGEFVVFGLPFGRWQTLQMFDGHARRWPITKLHVIGPEDDQLSRRADELLRGWSPSIQVVRHGSLPAASVVEILQQARFGLTNATEATWSKSTTFMALAASGCVPVIAGNRAHEVPLSFCIGPQDVATAGDAELQPRSTALAAWYREHADWPVIASRMAGLLR
jgi:hypothetical protein